MILTTATPTSPLVLTQAPRSMTLPLTLIFFFAPLTVPSISIGFASTLRISMYAWSHPLRCHWRQYCCDTDVGILPLVCCVGWGFLGQSRGGFRSRESSL